MLLGQLSRPPPEALLSQAAVLSCRETGSFGGGGAAWGGGPDVFDDGELQVHGESASGLRVHPGTLTAAPGSELHVWERNTTGFVFCASDAAKSSLVKAVWIEYNCYGVLKFCFFFHYK